MWKHSANNAMNHRYGIDTSVFVRLLTGEPDLVIRAELEPVWLDGGWKIKRRF